MALTWAPCKEREAQGVYCLVCEKLIADVNSLFTYRAVKGMHQKGSHEGRDTCEYVRLEGEEHKA